MRNICIFIIENSNLRSLYNAHLEWSVHARQSDLLMQRCLALVSTLPGAVGEEGAALVHPSQLVLQHRELVDLTKLFKHGSEVVILQVARNLTNKQFDCIITLLSIIVLFTIHLHWRSHSRRWIQTQSSSW